MNDKKIEELENKILRLEEWIKEISKYWNGADSYQELIENIKQAHDFKKLNGL